MEGSPKKPNRSKSILALALLAAALVLAAAALRLFTVRVGGRLYLCADTADARAAAISCEDYDAAVARRPQAVIRWSVPIGRERFDSFSETITLSALPEDEIGRLGYFPYLKTVDARACADCAALAAAAAEREDLQFLWTVPSPAGPVDGNTVTLDAAGLGAEEIEALLPLLPRLEAVDLRQSALGAAETDAFAAAHGELKTIFTVPLWGREIPGDTELLRLDAESAGDAEELAAALARLHALKKLDLRDCALTPRQLARALQVCEGVETDYVIRLCGRTFTADCEEMDLSGAEVDDLGELEAAVTLMPRLKKVVMCDCGVPSIYALRTDATFFCAADVPARNYDAPVLNDRQLYPIRYCRDLIALDLGHMWIEDLSFLYNMPHLQYLILVGGRFRDITPIGSLEDLKYLEIFQTQPRDISPLLNCKKLEQLNLCYCSGFDLAPLMEMKQLKRLWYAGLGTGRGAPLAAALPDTQVYCPYTDPEGSTGGGWREDEAYYEMRDVFAMYYQPGGTGIH